MLGILGLHKPLGITSRTALDQVSRLVRPVKAGHAGTLDPLATGVLVVCLGGATRLIERVQGWPKDYRAEFRLGCSSPSDDLETEVTEFAGATIPSEAQVRDTLPRFCGIISQIPPSFSAVKVNGQRAYRAAHRGKSIQITARHVVVHQIKLLRYEYPNLELQISCGSGTYIRSIGRDLAMELGTRAVMTALVRTAIGPITLGDCLPCEPKEVTLPIIRNGLQSPERLFTEHPRLLLNQQEQEYLRFGREIGEISTARLVGEVQPGVAERCWAMTTTGQCGGLLIRLPERGWSPEILFRETLEIC